MRQGIRARRAAAYARVQKWVAESQEVGRRAGREAVIRLQPVTAAIVGRLSDPLLWLRFAALLCMLMGGLLRMAEPDTWLGRPFASRFEAAKAGYRTLLQPRLTHLTSNDPGFPEILELALTSEQDLRDDIATERIGPIETIHAPSLGLRFGVGLSLTRISTAERMFRAPFRIQLEDRQGKSVRAILDYTEADLKARFFMPRLRWWALLALERVLKIMQGSSPNAVP
jgi:hypothetical protein